MRENHITMITAGKKHHLIGLLIEYHELLFFLSWRDILIRYKQTTLGFLWALLRPLLLMLVFAVLFGKILNLADGSSAPYPLIVFAGLLPWQFFAASVQQISDSFVQNANLISKVYFPRLIIPISSMVTAIVDFLISLLILAFIMLWFRYVPSYRIFVLPLFFFMLLLFVLGIGIFVATLNVYYRDFRYIIPFVIQLGFYISPVGFELSVIPEKWQLLYSFNPMVGIVEGFRWCLIGENGGLYWPSILISASLSVFFLFFGINIFQKMERNFADKV